jgi:hypothetical protein
MKIKNILFVCSLAIIFIPILIGCEGSDSANSTLQNGEMPASEVVMTIDTFSTFPPEIDGCSCYFSVDSSDFTKDHYIYMSDAETAILKINGILTKFTETERKEPDSTTAIVKLKASDYELTVQTKEEIQNGEETWLKTGSIKLSHKSGKTIIKPLYGECGC